MIRGSDHMPTPIPTVEPRALVETVETVTRFTQNLWWFLGLAAAGIAGLFRMGYRNRHAKLRIQVLERDVSVQQQDIAQLLMCNLAVLDGLSQMNCNGLVTSARDNLRMYLAKNRNVHIQED
jgi:hypothetical protein